MFFYLLNLAVSLVLTVVVFLLLTRCLETNWAHKNRHPISYLLPALLTMILVYQCIELTIPMLLDGIDVLADSCPIEEIYLEEQAVGRLTISDGERTLHFNPCQYQLEPGQMVQIRYTKRSQFILEVIPIEPK